MEVTVAGKDVGVLAGGIDVNVAVAGKDVSVAVRRLDVGVAVGGKDVGVLVGGRDVGVAVGPPGLTSEISSNQMSPVGEPSVIRRSVTLVFDPLYHVPLRYCQRPDVLAHSCRSPTMSAMSMQAPPVEFVRQM